MEKGKNFIMNLIYIFFQNWKKELSLTLLILTFAWFCNCDDLDEKKNKVHKSQVSYNAYNDK